MCANDGDVLYFLCIESDIVGCDIVGRRVNILEYWVHLAYAHAVGLYSASAGVVSRTASNAPSTDGDEYSGVCEC